MFDCRQEADFLFFMSSHCTAWVFVPVLRGVNIKSRLRMRIGNHLGSGDALHLSVPIFYSIIILQGQSQQGGFNTPGHPRHGTGKNINCVG